MLNGNLWEMHVHIYLLQVVEEGLEWTRPECVLSINECLAVDNKGYSWECTLCHGIYEHGDMHATSISG